MGVPVQTGVGGLDEILGGGLPASRVYLVEGDAGVGKTTLALQFALAGRSRGERVLWISLAETRAELEAVATSHGWSLEGIEVTERHPDAHLDENTLYVPAEVE